jgi:hypothetical protein
VIGVLKLRWSSLFKNYRKRLKNAVTETSTSSKVLAKSEQ